MIERDARNFMCTSFLKKYIHGHKGFIAGGCFKDILSGKHCKDVDVFFQCEADFAFARRRFENVPDYEAHYENGNVVAFKDLGNGMIIELCRKTYGTPSQIIGQFDFTVTKFAMYDDQLLDPARYELNKDDIYAVKVIFDDRYFEDLLLKRLVVDDKMLYPMSTFNRIIRYGKYGFSPCMETWMKIAHAISKLDDDAISLPETFYDGID